MLTLLLLCLASAAADVIGFTGLGGVLASAMTGNTALLGLALGEARLIAASRLFAALLGFGIGVGVGYLALGDDEPRSTHLLRVLAIETLALAAFAALWICSVPDLRSKTLYPLILLLSFGMGMQGAAARRIDLSGINTVVLTSTLIAIITAAVRFFRTRDQALPAATRQQLLSLCAYLAGAIVAGLLVLSSKMIACLLPVVIVSGACAVEAYRLNASRKAE